MWCWCDGTAVHVCVVGILGRGDVVDVYSVVVWCCIFGEVCDRCV